MMTKEEKILLLKKLKEEFENAKVYFEQLSYYIEKLEENFYEEFENL